MKKNEVPETHSSFTAGRFEARADDIRPYTRTRKSKYRSIQKSFALRNTSQVLM
jgi:hypothetical protein